MNIRELRKNLKKTRFGENEPHKLNAHALIYYNQYQPDDIYYYKNPKTSNIVYYYWDGIKCTVPIKIGNIEEVNAEFESMLNSDNENQICISPSVTNFFKDRKNKIE